MPKKTTAVTLDFTGEIPASLLEMLRRLAHDNLPLDSEMAGNIKAELTRRGVPLTLTESLLRVAREVERAGARVSFEARPAGVVLVTISGVRE